MAKTIITDELFRKEYKTFQRELKNIGTDLQFTEYLNKNYKPQNTELFTPGNVRAIRTK